jgi:TatD DNase family protein
MTMIDTHCHLTSEQYSGRVDAVMMEAARAGVTRAITISTTSVDAQSALRIAQSDPRIWCTAGVHPLHADEPIDWEVLRRVASNPRCVAWGELGLDNHYDHPPKDLQRQVLDDVLWHLERWTREGLARPVVIHCREAFDDLLPRLAASALPRDRFVFHCFTGTPEEARQVLDFGAWISFTGVVTFQNAPGVVEAARLVPLDRMMAETDAPFLSPEPVRTLRPNVPAFVVHVYRRLAHLRGEPLDVFARRLDENASRFFGIEGRSAGA